MIPGSPPVRRSGERDAHAARLPRDCPARRVTARKRVLSLLIERVLSSLLYEVSPIDPVVLPAATLLLAAVAMPASWNPARRAARLDPLTALRSE